MALIVVLGFAGRLSRGGDLLSFACSKESKQGKEHPATRVPLGFAAQTPSGQPAVLDHRAGPQNSLRAWQALRSNNCGQSDHEADASYGASAHPALCAPRHGQEGIKYLLVPYKPQ